MQHFQFEANAVEFPLLVPPSLTAHFLLIGYLEISLSEALRADTRRQTVAD